MICGHRDCGISVCFSGIQPPNALVSSIIREFEAEELRHSAHQCLSPMHWRKLGARYSEITAMNFAIQNAVCV